MIDKVMKQGYAIFPKHVLFDRKADAEAYCRGTKQPESNVFRLGYGWAAPKPEVKDEEKKSNT